MDENWIQVIAVYALPVIFAITLHEAAHGWMAQRLGDPTAAQLGRISINPVRHVDPVGTLLVPGLTLALGGAMGAFALFGWAKPVPVDARYFRRPARDMAWVAAAGPGMNLIMAFAWALLAKLVLMAVGMGGPEANVSGQMLTPLGADYILRVAVAGIVVNVALMVLNLLPLPPLDGSRVITALLPPSIGWRYAQLERYGLWILLILLFSGALGAIVRPVTGWMLQSIVTIFGLR
ncbi:MAG: site-2 protease family protein [Betaproteobacteria bacterium]|jgi:Zn-dependent protease|nr:site-2 protease family protein [Pseudomonadota bacterium]NBO02941.1 site-2 protease family protein [Betaproteobacteria bacterium]NBO94304.1 site-2 protease family protein [Betaproteobacteria bacterium]NBP34210.1 site-2 protease family protein [Betaproteobacteria bacterium]NBQ78015.1 site-2 protease family protein [Betaproteobacteria bacterium]